MLSKKPLDSIQLKLLFSARAPITLPEAKQRDLTAALADLLLHAAVNHSSAAIPEVKRKVENASEIDG